MTLSKGSKGFTLVEIMIVVAIIGLLASIAVPNFIQARTTARRNSCINNMRLIDAAKEQYAIENNKDSATTPVAADLSPYFKGSAMPTCPASGTYTIAAIGTEPTCSKSAAPELHVMP